MKIAILSAMFPYRGGIAQFNALIYRALLEQKHEVLPYTFTRQYPDVLFPGQTQYVTAEDDADKVPAKRILDTINPFSYWKTVKALRKQKPDVFITRYWMTFFAPSLGFVTGRMRKNAVTIAILDNVIPHEKRFFDHFCNRYFLKKSDGYIVMSGKVLDDLLKYQPNANYIRINHPVYNQFGAIKDRNTSIQRLGADPTKKTILFFGLIRDYKGLDVLIEAFSRLDATHQLVIAGEAYESFDKYTEMLTKFEIADRVHVFNQYIDDKDVGTYFSAADVCVLPYKTATQSGIAGIASHFNVPMIVTNVGGLKEYIVEGETGMVVETPDADLISAALTHYFTEEKQVDFAATIEKYKQEETWENFARKMVEFAEDLKKIKNTNKI